MIISHKHKFIFIKTEKTASTSLEIALSAICGPQDIITPITPRDEKIRKPMGRTAQNYVLPKKHYRLKHWVALLRGQKPAFYNHISAREIKNMLPKRVWESYFKFCFERNPFDKFISWYYWRGNRNQDISMREFIESGIASSIKGFELYTIEGKPVVDKIYRYEEMDKAINELNERFQPNKPIQLPDLHVKGFTRQDKRHYSEVLGSFEREAIEKIFARELKLMNYTF